MNEINWKEVAEKYRLSPAELEEQILVTSCVMSDMQIDREGDTKKTAAQFTCSQPDYDLELTVRRVKR